MNVNYIWILNYNTCSITKVHLTGEALNEANNCDDFDVFLDKLFAKLGVKESQVFYMVTEEDNGVEEIEYDTI